MGSCARFTAPPLSGTVLTVAVGPRPDHGPRSRRAGAESPDSSLSTTGTRAGVWPAGSVSTYGQSPSRRSPGVRRPAAVRQGPSPLRPEGPRPRPSTSRVGGGEPQVGRRAAAAARLPDLLVRTTN